MTNPQPEVVYEPWDPSAHAARPYPLSGNTLVEALDSIVGDFPQSTASFPGTNQVLTLAVLAAAADRVGSTLLHAGVERGEVVGVLMSTRAELLTSLFGIVRIGAVCSILPTPAGFSPAGDHLAQLALIADAARMKRIIADDTFAPAVALIAEQTTATTPVLIDLEALTRDAGPLPEPPSPTDEAVVQFPPGGTADPKGVTLTHDELTTALRACAVSGELRPDEVFPRSVPHCDDRGLVGLLSHLLNGEPVHVFSPLFFIRNADKILRSLSPRQVAVFTSPSFGYDHLCSVATPEPAGEPDPSAWRLAFSGAEPIRAEWIDRFATTSTAAGLSRSAASPLYGVAEATLAICFPQQGTTPRIEWVDRSELGRTGRVIPATPKSQQARAIVSVGKPAHGIEVRIVSGDGSIRGEGELGEFQISGPPVSGGCYRNAAASAESRDGDWVRTGDVGLCLDGDFFVTGRCDDLVVVRSSVDGDAGQVHAVQPRRMPRITNGKWKRSAARDEIMSGTDTAIATSPAGR